MKVLIATDSFKGTLDAKTVCQALGDAIAAKGIQTTTLPLSDGGEGLVDCFSSIWKVEPRFVSVQGPLGNLVNAKYLLKGDTALIEMAEAAGLPLATPLSPMEASTYGVGELIAHAIANGAQKIYLGLGGSATTDAGCGMAAALGVRFANAKGDPFVPTGGTLGEIVQIQEIAPIDVVALCDVTNPLYGENGAAYVYAPQKGATPTHVAKLDQGLRHVATFAPALANTPGSGAAGGMGYGVMHFLGGKLARGIDAVLEASHFDALAREADYIITGEGRIDSQSLQGKVVAGVVAHRKGAKILAVVGQNQLPNCTQYGIEKVFDTAKYLSTPDYKAEAMTTLLRTAQEVAEYLASKK